MRAGRAKQEAKVAITMARVAGVMEQKRMCEAAIMIARVAGGNMKS